MTILKTQPANFPTTPVDLLIIGGGINGTGIARDAAGRGLSVILCEKDDLASGTSSKSSKLIHGGLRYLEYGEFRLVREALIERETLLRSAPHLVEPLRIVLPHHKGLRPKWMLRFGLFIYDHLGGRKLLPGTKVANLHTGSGKGVLKPEYKTGFVFSDCRVDDARLVVCNALGAQNRGAHIATRTKCIGLSHTDDLWQATLQNQNTGQDRIVSAKCVINASGVRVDEIVELALGREHPDHLRLVKGSHIVTKRLYEGDKLYMFQNPDGRIIFAIPYQDDFTLIGTTDAPYELSDDPIEISDTERDYLLGAANSYFQKQISVDDIVWSYAGVRPLYDNNKQSASAVTRDYVFDLMDTQTPPILSIFGGKITTYRELSEHALAKLRSHFPDMAKQWTANSPIWGGDYPQADFDSFVTAQQHQYSFLPPALVRHYCSLYGSKINHVLDGVSTVSDLGERFGRYLTACEVRYLVTYEWAQTSDDILWRRTKEGLQMDAGARDEFKAWFATEFTA